MRAYIESFNQSREVEDFINKHGIEKESVVSVFRDAAGTYTLVYYAE